MQGPALRASESQASVQRNLTTAMTTMAEIWKTVSATLYLKWLALELNFGGSPPIQNLLNGMLVRRGAVEKRPSKHRCRKVWILTVRVGLE